MKNTKKSILALLSLPFMVSIVGLAVVFAATTPPLGLSATYGILASTYTNTSAGSTINGDVGFTTGPAVAPLGTHVNYGSGAPYATAGIDQGIALSALDLQACTFTFPAGAIDLSTDTTHGGAGVYAPGVYCSSGAMDVGGPINLSGNGTFIFRSAGALTTTAGATVTLSGTSACDVFWTPSEATTLAANTTFAGTVIGNAGITVGANTTWLGRALAFGGTVTSDTVTITVPSCTVVPPPVETTLNVIKQVVNTNGGTTTPANFSIHVKTSGSDVSGSPSIGIVAPGTLYSLSPGTYTIDEDLNSSYVKSFSGDCDSNGNITLAVGDNKTCTIINTYIAPAVVIVPPVVPGGAVLLPVVTPIVIPVVTVATPQILGVTTPNFPQTGLPPKKTGSGILIITGILAIASLAFTFRKCTA